MIKPNSQDPTVFRPRARAGFALIITLLIVSALVIVAVSFLASMSGEQQTAHAYATKIRASQAAQAGVDSAMAILREAFKDYPDSATVWETQSNNADGTTNDGTNLYLRAAALSNNAGLPDPAGNNSPNNVDSTGADIRKTFVLPLVSGATVQLQAAKLNAINGGTALPTTSDSFINLNTRRRQGDIQGWIGSPPSATALTAPKPFRVPWVEIKQQDGVNTGATAPTVARYAYWVEDESFKANVNLAALGNTASLHQRRDNLANVGISPADLDLLGPLNILADANSTADAQSIWNTRNNFPSYFFPEPRAYTQSSLTSTLADQLRYLTTTTSSSLNLSRHGSQRLNLNAVVDPTVLATNTVAVQKQIDKIVQTMKYHAPNFGQRLYRATWSGTPPVVTAANLNSNAPPAGVASTDAPIYFYKIAANIRDYIDPDAVPTVILAGGAVNPPSRPVQVMNFTDQAANPYWAIGKDSAPFLSEAAVRFVGTLTGTTYSVNVDYYIEFWNMSTRTVAGSDLGPNNTHPYIRISNPPAWVGDLKSNWTGTQTSLTPTALGLPSLSDTRGPNLREFDIDLTYASFPPGVCTVITTDPSWAAVVPSISDPNAANEVEAAKHFEFCNFLSPGKRTYKGTLPTGCDEIRMRYDSTSSSDYETGIIVGNDNGYIDSLEGAVAISGGFITTPVGTPLKAVYGGYLRGNLAAGTQSTGSGASGGMQPAAIGDPRSNNEQLFYYLDPPTNGDTVDSTRFKVYDAYTLQYGVPPSFGLPNFNSIAPSKWQNPWPDYNPYPLQSVATAAPMATYPAAAVMTFANAPAVIANAPLVSIAQLGDIYDPARLPSTSGAANIPVSRGGGRTLRLGQHDDLYDGGANSPSSTWASWRLADFFCIDNSIEQPGLININGLARDNGAALQAALQGFSFQPQTGNAGTTDPLLHGDPQLDSKTLSSTGIQNLITDIINNRLKNTNAAKPGPFFERGELSETPLLNPNISPSPAAPLVSGVNMASVYDRGREELVRRLVEMTTTRGNVFTVYAIGQSITQTNPADATTKHVTGTQQLKITFRLVPRNAPNSTTGVITDFHPATDASGNPTDFDPNSTTQLNARFAKPDHYDIQVLSSSSGNS